MKQILFAAAEAVPFVKTGGLADVVGSLPKYYEKDAYDVRVVLPKYSFLAETYRERMERVGVCPVCIDARTEQAGIDRLTEDGVTFYFIEHETYFAGDGPYGEMKEDVKKFAFFSEAVLTMLPVLGWQPDILHCHDWHTGLIPVFLAALFGERTFYRRIHTVYTIHNLRYQGNCPMHALREMTGLPQAYFTEERLVHDGEANLMQGGIVFSDAVTTVSKTYAGEIRTPEGGEGMDGLLRKKGDRLVGIPNGLDYRDQDPETDPRIAVRLADDPVAYKSANKADLQRALHLNEREEIFLIGMVSRLTGQKGFDLVGEAMDGILADGEVQLAILGTGEERYETMLKEFGDKYPGRVSANLCYSEDLAQRIYASCDAFLMPSLFEPCGLSQLMALRYGAVPLVRKTGGLADTVEPYDESAHTGTGFNFFDYNAQEMRDMIRRAHNVFSAHPDEWTGIMERGMAMDFSWDASCRKYEALYDEMVDGETGECAVDKADAGESRHTAAEAAVQEGQ